MMWQKIDSGVNIKKLCFFMGHASSATVAMSVGSPLRSRLKLAELACNSVQTPVDTAY